MEDEGVASGGGGAAQGGGGSRDNVVDGGGHADVFGNVADAASDAIRGDCPGEWECLSTCRCMVTLASTLGSPKSFLVSDAFVYWTSFDPGSVQGRVAKVPIVGGSPTTLASMRLSPGGMAVYDAEIYWIAGGVFDVPAVGGEVSTLATGPSDRFGESMAADETTLYWTTYEGSISGMGIIMEMPRDGGTPQILAAGQGPANLVIDSRSVYWADGSGRIMTIGLSGGSAREIAANQVSPAGIAVNGGEVFWTTYGGSVMKAVSDGSALGNIALGQHDPNGVAADSSNVYWVNSVDGTIMKVSRSGGTPEAIAYGQSDPYDIALDATSVYWTNAYGADGGANGSIVKLSPK